MKTFAIVASAGGLAAAIVLAGCSGEPERGRYGSARTTPSVSETERPGTSQPSDLNPMTAHLRVSDLKVGTVIAANGTVAEDVDLLHPGDPVHASIAVGDVGTGSRIKAVWLGPNDLRIGDEVQTVQAGAATLVFHAPETSTWAAGAYKVEIYLGDELASSDSFDIVALAPPA